MDENILVNVLALTAFGLLCVAGSAWAGQMVNRVKLTDTNTSFDNIDTAFQAVAGTSFFEQFNEKIGTLYGLQISHPSSPVSSSWPVEGFSFDMAFLSREMDATHVGHHVDMYGSSTPGTDSINLDLDSSKVIGQGEKGTYISSLSDFGHAPVPEMAAMLLFGTVLIGLAGVGRKLRK